MRRWIVGVSAFVCVCARATAQDSSIGLDLVTYKQLGGEVKKLQGQVVLVDFWADYCRPCKQKFPHVLSLYKKYAGQGLSLVTVSVDDVEDAQARERAKSFLRQQQATCRNLLLAEKPEAWVPKLKMNSVPTMFLFDRQGRLINRWAGEEIDLGAIEKRVAELLAAETK